MTEITRDVIIDLLPAYFSEEASEQTRKLVEEYFVRDPDFERMVRKMNDKISETVIASLPEDHEMHTLRMAKQQFEQRFLVLLFVIMAFVGTIALIGLFWIK